MHQQVTQPATSDDQSIALAPAPNRRALPWLIALIVTGVFAVIASMRVAFPGVYYDELIQITPALECVKGPLGSSVSWMDQTRVTIHGHSLPTMTMQYLGSLKTIAYLPIAAWRGISPASVR